MVSATSDESKQFSLTQPEKESISDRLRLLIGSRTVRSAAEEWGLPFSTLNNYLSRGTEPSLNVAIKIANVERVPVEWLASGRITLDEAHKGSKVDALTKRLEEAGVEGFQAEIAGVPSTTIDGAIASAWSTIFELLTPQERYDLVHIFFRMGASGALEKLREINDTDLAWSALSLSEKQRLVRLNEKMKKGPSEPDSGVGQQDLASTDKKAG